MAARLPPLTHVFTSLAWPGRPPWDLGAGRAWAPKPWLEAACLLAALSVSRGRLLLAGEEDGRDQSKLETKVWEAHNPLTDKQIDQFLVVAR